MTAALISILLAQSSPNVTIEQPATALKNVLPKLEQQTGQKLTASDDLLNSRVILRFDSTPAQAALDKLATAFKAEWVESKGVKWLMRKPQPKSAPETNAGVHKYFEEIATISKLTEAKVDEIITSALALSEAPSPVDYTQIQKFNRSSASSRMVAKMMLLIGEKAVTEIQPHTRVVYSTSPTAMQRALPTSALSAIQEFNREGQLYHEALVKRGYSEENRANTNYWMPILEVSQQEIKNAAVINVALKNAESGLVVELDVLSNQGETLQSENDYVSIYQPEDRKPQDSTAGPIEGELALSPESTALGRLMGSTFGMRNREATEQDKAKVLDIFRDLEKNEILSYAPSEVILQLAKSLKVDVVIEARDLLLTLLFLVQQPRPQAEGPVRLQEVAKQLEQFGIFKFDPGSRQLAFDPPQFALFDRFTVPRKPVSQFVRTVEKTGVTLDALADLSAVTAEDDLFGFVQNFAMMPFPDSKKSDGNYGDTSALRLYGSLDQGSRNKAKNGGYTVQYGSLPPQLAKAVAKFVYFDKGKLSVGEPRALEGDAVQHSEIARDGTADFANESTTLFPQGLPGTAKITFSVKRLTGVMVRSQWEGGGSNDRITRAEEAISTEAWRQVMPESYGNYKCSYSEVGYEQLDVIVDLGSKRFAATQYRLADHLADSKFTGFDKLPDTYKKDFDKRLAEYREMAKNGTFQPPRGKIKP